MKSKVSDDDIKKALEKSNSFLSEAARHLGISPQALWSRIKHSDELRDFRKGIISRKLDFVENELLNMIAGRGAKRAISGNFINEGFLLKDDTREGVPENVRVKAMQIYLDAHGQARGYGKPAATVKEASPRFFESALSNLADAIEKGGEPLL